MSKKIWVFTLIMSLAISLSACNGSTSTVSEKTSSSVQPTSSLVEETREEETTDDQEAVVSQNNTGKVMDEEGIDPEQTTDDRETNVSQDNTEQSIDEEGTGIAQQETLEKRESQNSFSMMYYLAITAEQIRIAKDNRLMLEDIYTSLLNDINPSAVDEITQDQLKSLRDILKSFLNISVKRDRLQFIYNQNKASAIRSAVPNPLAILSMTQSFDWKRLAISVTYSLVDSYNSYKKADEKANLDFLMSGWDLDDEETATIQRNRDHAFDYMVDMVQEYHLDGMKTLNEKAIGKFAEISAIESIPEKIRRLVSEEETYSLLGSYWLELAGCYFETSKYDKCLECVERYKSLAAGIYRKDIHYANILPKAIVAAQNVYSEKDYIEVAKAYANDLLENTPKDEDHWSQRYFVAQVYMDLYAKTNDPSYLEKAYEIIYENTTCLLKEQREINATYLNEVKEITVEEPNYDYMPDKEKEEAKKKYKEEKKRANEYNKALKEARKTEIPTLYDPLIMHCELLFQLAEKRNISESEKQELISIMNPDEKKVFLPQAVVDFYSFSNPDRQYSLSMNKTEIIIPVTLLTAGSVITVTVTEGDTHNVYEDCVITKVIRKANMFDWFEAHVSSKKLQAHSWTDHSKITITIHYADVYDKSNSFNFYVSKYDPHWYGDNMEFTLE